MLFNEEFVINEFVNSQKGNQVIRLVKELVIESENLEDSIRKPKLYEYASGMWTHS
jgi:hypothetical protein